MARRRIIAGVISVTLIVALFAAPSAAGKKRKKQVKRTTVERIARGVKFTTIRDPKGPWAIRIISIKLASRSTIDVALAQDVLPGFETTSSMARRHGALAAINGDYALSSGRPVYTFAEDGWLAQTTAEWGRNFAVSKSEKHTYVGHPQESAWAFELDSETEHPVARVNQGDPYRKQLAQYSSVGGDLERPPRNACSARLSPLETPRARPSGEIGLQVVHGVTRVRCQSSRMARGGGTVVSAPDGGPRAPQVSALVPGELVALGWSLGWKGVFDTVGGNPVLVEDGRIAIQDEESAFFRRHPRTGVATTSDGKVLFVTVDGRQRRYSVGMTPIGFARLLRSLGAEWALNLDGGGSTTMVVEGDVKGSPSDGRERPVSSALLLLPRKDAGERPSPPAPSPSPTPTLIIPTPTPSVSPTTPAGSSALAGAELIQTEPYQPDASAWQLIARDPASTGGLASWLGRSRRLPPALERAARVFESR
jgi:exopolysaccharide biosynthesis protein